MWPVPHTSCLCPFPPPELDDRDLNCLLASLVQVVSDPHARTISGFQSLVQKEWVAAGHPFLQRLNLFQKNDREEVRRLQRRLLKLIQKRCCLWNENGREGERDWECSPTDTRNCGPTSSTLRDFFRALTSLAECCVVLLLCLKAPGRCTPAGSWPPFSRLFRFREQKGGISRKGWKEADSSARRCFF